MNPSELLAAAADRVRDLAAKATDGPWETIGDTGGIWREASPERAVRTSPGYIGVMDAAEDARWIASMSPALAAPLEAWLRQAAREVDEAWRLFEPGTTRFTFPANNTGLHTGEVSSGVWTEESRLEAIQPRWGAALDLARTILGDPAAPRSGMDTHEAG